MMTSGKPAATSQPDSHFCGHVHAREEHNVQVDILWRRASAKDHDRQLSNSCEWRRMRSRALQISVVKTSALGIASASVLNEAVWQVAGVC